MRKLTFEDSVVEADLSYWGRHKRGQILRDGYSPSSAIEHIASGVSTATPGHRLLVKDMPARAWRINARVMQLTGSQRLAVIGRYCLPVKDTGPMAGQQYTQHEIARAIGVSLRQYRTTLGAARRAYRAIVFAKTVDTASSPMHHTA